MTSKQEDIRRIGRAARAALSDVERDVASEKIADKVIHAHWFQRASSVACYLPTHDEVDTWKIIARAWRMKKRVFAPVTEKNRRMRFLEMSPETDLRLNEFGLYEPVDGEIASPRKLEIVITPVVAFDGEYHRVGMGGGFFDTTFSFLGNRHLSLRPKLIGVAFACQKVKKIAPNPWDIRLFSVFSESG